MGEGEGGREEVPDELTHTHFTRMVCRVLSQAAPTEQRLLGRLISNKGGQAAPVPTLQVAKLNTKHSLTSGYQGKLGFILGSVLDPGQRGH